VYKRQELRPSAGFGSGSDACTDDGTSAYDGAYARSHDGSVQFTDG